MRVIEEIREVMGLLGLICTDDFAKPLLSDKRVKLLFGGWRASKTVHEVLEGVFWILEWLLLTLMGGSRNRLIWLVGPDYKQTREEYRYFREWLPKLGFQVQASDAQEGPRTITATRNGLVVTIETKSAQDPQTLASVAPDLVIACECGQLSDETMDMIWGRAGEKNAPVVLGGTVEDDEGHQQWAWYQETAREWLDAPNSRHEAWCLPSWENPLFRTCLPWVEDDPELGVTYCPDGNHGEAHGYRNHPVIKQWEANFDPYTFARRIAAIPTGVQYAVYPATQEKTLLLPIPQSALGSFRDSAGGVDYGTVHPSALVVVQLAEDVRDRQVSFVGPRGIAWVREVRLLVDGGDTFTLARARKEMAERWRCFKWNVDPNERYMAKSWQGEATSYSTSAREARIGLVTARLNLNKLMFDLDGPGVRDLYEEMKRVHRRKTRMGQLELVRVDDDRTAALEDAIEMLDGKPHVVLPPTMPMRPRRHAQATRRPEYSRRV